MSELFCECSSLELLPDISKWEMNNIKYINRMFLNCSSLLFLPDISKWNIKNKININNIFKGCTSLLIFPDISKWNFLNNLKLEESSSLLSLTKENILIDSDNINSSDFLNKPEKINHTNEYNNVKNVDFSVLNDSLNSYYEDFYT